jgi:hypothetical protein
MSTGANRSLVSRFQQLQWAFQGLSEVLNPDQVLDSQERANLSALLGVLAAELGRILNDAMRKAELLEQLLADASASPSTSAPEETLP